MHSRQGDVLVEACPIPADAKRVERNGRIVLAYGEVTGHAHAIHEADVELYEKDGTLYLKVPTEATIVHEEHATVPLKKGTYRAFQQSEYRPEAIRNVAD